MKRGVFNENCYFPFTFLQIFPCFRATAGSDDRYDRASSPLQRLLVQTIVSPITER